MSKWNNPPPVVILSGDEDFLRQRELQEAVASADRTDRSVEWLENPTTDELSTTLSSSGVFFTEKTLIVVEGAQGLSASFVLEHHEKGSADCCVLIHEPGAIKAKSVAAQIAKGLPERLVAKFKKPKPWEMEDHLARFLMREANSRKVKLGEPLARALVRNVGEDFGVLSFELEKLTLFVTAESRTDITVDDLKACVGASVQGSPKPLVSALAARDPKLLHRNLAYFKKTHLGQLSTAVIQACVFISRAAMTWLEVASYLKQGLSAEDISHQLEVHKFVVQKEHLPVARRWGEKKTIELLQNLGAVERAVKLGHSNPWIQLECLLLHVVTDTS